ncbi:MAG: hypothetical protein RSC49_01020 [Clostridium sp.]
MEDSLEKKLKDILDVARSNNNLIIDITPQIHTLIIRQRELESMIRDMSYSILTGFMLNMSANLAAETLGSLSFEDFKDKTIKMLESIIAELKKDGKV